MAQGTFSEKILSKMLKILDVSHETENGCQYFFVAACYLGSMFLNL